MSTRDEIILVSLLLFFSCTCARPAVKDERETMSCAEQEELVITGPRGEDGSQTQVRETRCKTWMTPHGEFRSGERATSPAPREESPRPAQQPPPKPSEVMKL